MEHHRDEDRREELEEALHPQVNDPEAPVVDDGEVGARAVEERRQIEERDGGGGVQEERPKLGSIAAPHHRPQRPIHQHEPEGETDREQNLPEPAQVQVLRALVAEPEPGLAQRAVDAQVLPEEAAEDDDRQGRQQHDDARSLPARFCAADERRQQEPAGDPRRGDPEDRQLQVPRARQVVREHARQVDAVEPAGLDPVVREHAAEERLRQEEDRDDARGTRPSRVDSRSIATPSGRCRASAPAVAAWCHPR